ncbi:putative quinol monooxygenase [Paraburkholderia tropica]|uniref:putative quinol monooxygenase n=1 Tax=Paraburkholderia tropica TaxID=92647 RepID=UPI003D28A193
MSNPIVIVATITTTAEHRNTVEGALREAVHAARAEAGCEQYELHRDTEVPDRFMMLERWRDEAALEAHAKGAAFSRVSSVLNSRASLEVVRLAKVD